MNHIKKISFNEFKEIALGKQDDECVLDKILEVNYDENGQIKFTDKELLQIKKHPYTHKGMIWLSDPKNMMEVLEYYEKKRPKSQKKLFDELKNDVFNIFTSCIPVYSSLLRLFHHFVSQFMQQLHFLLL